MKHVQRMVVVVVGVAGLVMGNSATAQAVAGPDPWKSKQAYLNSPIDDTAKGMSSVFSSSGTAARGALSRIAAAANSGATDGPIIAILGDGYGVDMTHQDLVNQALREQLNVTPPAPIVQYDCTGPTCTPALTGPFTTAPTAGTRATAVAGIAAADSDNSIGMFGVCPACRILNVKADTASAAGIVRALDRAVSAIKQYYNPADPTQRAKGVILIVTDNNQASDATLAQRLIDIYLQQGNAFNTSIVVVAPAGNGKSDGGSPAMYYPSDTPGYPCAYTVTYTDPVPPNPSVTDKAVLCVGAIDTRSETRGQRSVFSNFGPDVDLSAPGQQIVGTLPGNGYGYVYDTAAAAAIVAGTAGILHVGVNQTPQLLTAEIFTSEFFLPGTRGGVNPRLVSAGLHAAAAADVAVSASPTTEPFARLNAPLENANTLLTGGSSTNIRGSVDRCDTYSITLVPKGCATLTCGSSSVIKIATSCSTLLRRPNSVLLSGWTVPNTEGEYELQLFVTRASPAGSTTSSARFFIDKSYDSSFNSRQPLVLNDIVFHGPNLADLNGNGTPEIVLGSASGKVSAYTGLGSLLFAPLQATGRIFGIPAVGNIDTDPEPEIVAVTDISGSPSLYAWNTNRTTVFAPLQLGASKSSPVLANTTPSIPTNPKDIFMTITTNELQWRTGSTGALKVGGSASLTQPQTFCLDPPTPPGSWACNGTALMESSPIVAVGVKGTEPVRIFVPSQDPRSTFGFTPEATGLSSLVQFPMPWESSTTTAPGGMFDGAVAYYNNSGALQMFDLRYRRDTNACESVQCQDASELVLLEVQAASATNPTQPRKKKKDYVAVDSVFDAGPELFMYSGAASGNIVPDRHDHWHCHSGGSLCHSHKHSHNKHVGSDVHLHDAFDTTHYHDPIRAYRRKPKFGDLETAIVGMSGKVYVLDEDAELVESELDEPGELCSDGSTPGWPQQMRGRGAGTPLIADIDGDGLREVIATSSDNLIYAWDHNGCLKRTLAGSRYGFPRAMKSPACSLPGPAESPIRNWSVFDILRCGAIATGDLDADGHNEVIAVAGSGALSANAIYVWDFIEPPQVAANWLWDRLFASLMPSAEAVAPAPSPAWPAERGSSENSGAAALAILQGSVKTKAGAALANTNVTVAWEKLKVVLDPLDSNANGVPDEVDAGICPALAETISVTNGTYQAYRCHPVTCRTTTNNSGLYTCLVNPGAQYDVTASPSGYAAQTIKSGVTSLDSQTSVDFVFGCHVLTAAFGRGDAPQIQTLWQLHHVLVPDWNAPWHQRYLAWYDREGPKLAAFLQDKPLLRALIRAVFTPAARAAQWWLDQRNAVPVTE